MLQYWLPYIQDKYFIFKLGINVSLFDMPINLLLTLFIYLEESIDAAILAQALVYFSSRFFYLMCSSLMRFILCYIYKCND